MTREVDTSLIELMNYLSLLRDRNYGVLALLSLISCSCVTSRPDEVSSSKVALSMQTRSLAGSDLVGSDDTENEPLEILRSKLKNRERARFSETVECSDGMVLPLPNPPEAPPAQSAHLPEKKSWNSDQEATKSHEKDFCRLSRWHRIKLDKTIQELTVIFQTQQSLIQIKSLLNSNKDKKETRKTIQGLEVHRKKIQDLWDTIDDQRAAATPRAEKIYQLKLESLELVLKLLASVQKNYRNTLFRTERDTLNETLKTAILKTEDLLNDVLVDVQSQTYQVRWDSDKGLKPIESHN